MIDKIFKDRDDAYKQLYDKLPIASMKMYNWIVIATSLNSVPIAYKLSKDLEGRFDFLFTQKITAAHNSECEIAIISETQEIVIHEELLRSFGIDIDDIYQEAKQKYNKDIQEMILKYRDGKKLINMQDANVLLIDEGLNTGSTMMACIKTAIGQKAKSIAVAVPVLPEVTIDDVDSIADDLYYVKSVPHFVAIDSYYENLENLSYKDIKKIME